MNFPSEIFHVKVGLNVSEKTRCLVNKKLVTPKWERRTEIVTEKGRIIKYCINPFGKDAIKRELTNIHLIN